MVRVFINGYGNIGRRLAAVSSSDKEVQFIGIAKYTADDKAKDAMDNGFDIYVPDGMVNQFKEKGYDVTGVISQAIRGSDLVVDAAKEGGGYDNKKSYMNR